ncbi:hypothetical protein [Amycolatopsis sp. NPDC021455]|uniref:hypothetical protein n=1 Tax=Amycolatopsis sp. NPDC021455 TaxID=3154901 RepID=UPI0033C51C6B
MKNPTLRRVLVVTTVVGATLGGGIAVAAWTSSGTGTAGAKAGTAAAPTTGTVDASALTTGLLYPGVDGNALIRITNPNPYPVKVTGVTGNGTATATGTCPGNTVTWNAKQPNTVIAAGDTATITLTGAVSMAPTAADACQGAVFTIPVTVTVSS